MRSGGAAKQIENTSDLEGPNHLGLWYVDTQVPSAPLNVQCIMHNKLFSASSTLK